MSTIQWGFLQAHYEGVNFRTMKNLIYILMFFTVAANAQSRAIGSKNFSTTYSNSAGLDSYVNSGQLIYCTDCIGGDGTAGDWVFYKPATDQWVSMSIGNTVRQLVQSDTITFDRPKQFGSEYSPRSGAYVYFNFLNARTQEQIFFHKAAAAPYWPVGTEVRGTYSNNNINFIRVEFINTTRFNVIYNE